MKRRIPRLAKIVRSYLRLFDPGIVEHVDFMERSRLKGERLRQMRMEVERIEQRRAIRAGSTLTEVLIALLIFSIGIVSLATLFPISVLRSIKATQFTTATDNRYNAEAMIALFPNMIRNPDYTLDPITLKIAANSHNGENFIVDPLGYAELAIPSNSAATKAMAPYFGNDPAFATGTWPMRRFPMTTPAAQQTEAAADGLVTMPDSWVLQHQGMRTATGAAGDGSTQIDIQGLSASGFTFPTLSAAEVTDGRTPPSVRVVMFSADGLSSQARPLTGVAGNTVTWNDPLPTAFVPGGKCRVEWQERRYSWLLTVRKDLQGGASVDVVVFFKRKFEQLTDERLYSASFTSGINQVTVKYPVGSAPFMHKGNYIFDANNAFWYRISNVNDNGQGTAQIVLDVPANLSSPKAVAGQGPYAMFPRNIVDVYPLGGK